MPSPVIPSDICELKPTASTPPCDAVKTLFFNLPDLLCEFFGWMLNADGTISEEFKRELNAFPAGLQVNFAGLTVPAGFLYCNGGAYKQADYPYLYLAIGTRFGAGNGIDEFQVPNMGGRVVVGVSPTEGYTLAQTGGQTEVTLTEDQIPSVLIPVEGSGIVGDQVDGELKTGAGEEVGWASEQTTSRFGRTIDLGDALQPVTTLMPFIVMTPCIKT